MGYFCILLGLYAISSYLKIRFKTDRQKGVIDFLLIFPMFFLSAFRAVSIGNDTIMYLYGYEKMASYSSLIDCIQSSRYELGYDLLCYISNYFGLSFYALQFVISAFIYLSFFWFFRKYSTNFAFSCFIFLALRYSIGTMNVVRMWIAASILLYSIQFIMNRKLLKFIAVVMLASLFHASALVFLLIYPIYRMKLSKKNIFLIIAASGLLMLIGTPLFSRITSVTGRYEGYLQSVYFNSNNNLAVYLSLLIDLCLFAFIYIVETKQTNMDNHYNVESPESYKLALQHLFVICGLLVLSIEIVGMRNTIMSRVSSYYGVFYTVSVPFAISSETNKNNKLIMQTIIVVSLIVQFLVVMILRPKWNGVTPYLFFWQ